METQILEYDALTGALTRSTFAFRLNEEHERALRYHLPFSLVVVDLDHFKSINDAFGHARGDQVLIEFARRTQATLRTNDLIFRYGGDEFVLLLPYTTRVEAASLAKRLLDTIQSLPFGSNPPITLTLSIGIAAFPEDAETIEDLFEAADKRSYAAKRAGRARIVAENLDTAARITHLPEPGRLLERDQAQEKLQDFLKVLTLRQRGILLVEGPEKAGHSRLVNEARKLARLQGYATLALQAQPGFKSRRYASLFTALTEQAHLPYLPQDEQTLATALAHWISDKGYAGLVVTIDNPAEIDLSSLAFLLYLFNTACLPALALVWAGRGGLEWANRFSNPPLQEIIKILPLSLPSLRVWLRHSLQWEAPGPLLEWFFDQTGGLPGLIQGGLELMLAHKMLRPASEKDKGWETADNWKSFSLAEKQAQRRDATTLHNLPSGLTELVGRDLELRQLSERLSQQQLVSLVGPGGIGKTRLALQVAAESLEKYSQGIYFVALAGLEAEEMVLGAISAAIGLETDGAKLKTQLLNYLRDREILLVLDNFEHLLPHTSLLLTLLEAAPQLRLLVTTREPLNLPGEQIILLAGLSYPPETVVTNLEDYAAIQLFRQNVRLVQAEFGLDRENGPSVARICRVMQGLPLGINLMAAWVNTFSPAQIATWLENQEADFWQTFPSNPANTLQADRILRGVLDSFWKLLGRGEQSVLVRLGAFRGSFSHRAAREVSGASLFFLEGLVLRAFLQRQEPGYYQLHELIRQYLVAKLTNQPVRQRETQARHARYFGKVLAELHTGLGWREIPALEKMTYKLENGRIAWEWALANRDADLLLKVGRSLSYFYQYRGFIQEGEREFGRALECFQEGGEAHLIGWLLLEKAVFLNLKGSTDEAYRCLQQALELLGSNRNIEAYLQELIYRTRGDVLRKKGKYAAARDEFQKMLELGQHSGDQHLQVQALVGLARAGLVMQDFDALDYYCQKALTLETVKANPNQAQFFFSMLGRGERDRGRADKALYYLKRARETLPANASPQSTGILFSYEGLVYRLVGDYDTAQHRFEEALTYHKDPQALFDQMYCLSYLGMLFHLKGDNERAIEYCRRALAMSEQVHLVKMKCDTLTRLGRSQTALGDYIAAEEVFSQALELGRETKQTDTIVDALAGLVELWTTLPVSPDELAERTYELRDWVLGTDKPLPIGASEVLRPYLVCYRALLKLNDLAEAHALLQLMHAKLWQIAKGIEDADLRAAFLNRKDVHAEIRQLAALLRCQDSLEDRDPTPDE